jgi:anti-sigma regulatory factor (Ser/Thr protein kinase)
MELESRPESITLVRSTLGGLGEYLELDHELLDDLKTAISEACNNVVLHAYGDAVGPLLMSLEIGADSFDVTVRDRGAGIQRVSPADNRMGVGLAVISALANRAEFQSAPGEGTEVRMSFGTHGRITAELPTVDDAATVALELAGDIVATLSPAELLSEVLGRLVRAVAAGAHFAVDRFPALHHLTSAIGARASVGAPGRAVSLAITGRPRQLELRVGPLAPTDGGSLFDGPPPPALAPLLRTLETTPFGEAEMLYAVIVEPRE